MAKNQTRRLTPRVRENDVAVLNSLRGIGDYAPRDEEASIGKLTESSAAIEQALIVNTQAEDAFLVARDSLVAAEWRFHNALLTAKKQIIGQYGDDSNEAQAVGIKKVSERKAPGRRAQPPVNPN
ncbi:MAG: hypothetical protein AAB071_02820 [Bacteroidota bacterium]